MSILTMVKMYLKLNIYHKIQLQHHGKNTIFLVNCSFWSHFSLFIHQTDFSKNYVIFSDHPKFDDLPLFLTPDNSARKAHKVRKICFLIATKRTMAHQGALCFKRGIPLHEFSLKCS